MSSHSAATVAGPPSNGETTARRWANACTTSSFPGPKLGPPINPALFRRERERAKARQNRAADAITGVAGSMLFVYVHIIWFGCWIGFGAEDYPYGLLTMIVSLEAIFLSTFVLISQNRADARRQVIADEQWTTVQKEDKQNIELLDLSRQILALTKEVRALADPSTGRSRPSASIDPATEVSPAAVLNSVDSPEPVGGHGDTPAPLGATDAGHLARSAGRGAPRRLVEAGRRARRGQHRHHRRARHLAPLRRRVPDRRPYETLPHPNGAGPSAGPLQLDLDLCFVVAHLDLDLELHLVGHVHRQALARPLHLDVVVGGKRVGDSAEPCSGLLSQDELHALDLQDLHGGPSWLPSQAAP
jgi:hypothetical protein